jgi:hypothetical protein
MKLVLFVLLQTSIFAHAAPGLVKCENDTVIFSYNLISAHEIQNFQFAFKATPDDKSTVQTPADQNGGVFDVSFNGKERYIELPPYVANADVNQFFVDFQAYDFDGKGHDYQEDIGCKN